MTQTGQAKADHSVSALIGNSGVANSGGTEVLNAPQFLCASAQSVVERALRSAEPSQGTNSRAEYGAPGKRADSLGSPTRRRKVAEPDLRLPPPTAPASRMVTLHALQEWEGYVVGIEDDAFVARLVDLTAGESQETEEATIPLEEISDRDAANMKIGDIFRWVIGYELSPEGTRKRVSQIVFRDLPRMTAGDLRAGGEWAHRLAAALNL